MFWLNQKASILHYMKFYSLLSVKESIHYFKKINSSYSWEEDRRCYCLRSTRIRKHIS